jgi:transposase
LASKSVAKVATIFGFKLSTAYHIKRKYLKTGSTSSRPKSGRPSILTEAAKRHICRIATKNQCMLFAEVANVLGIGILESMVCNIMA